MPGCRITSTELLEECARVRNELGYPIMITPFAQLVGTQAVLNVVQDERYRIVPDEVKKYALGYYGKLPGAGRTRCTRPHRRQRLAEDRAQAAAACRRPSPSCASNIRTSSDDERLLRFMFAGGQVDEMLGCRADGNRIHVREADRAAGSRTLGAAPIARSFQRESMNARAHPLLRDFAGQGRKCQCLVTMASSRA